jgi:subtilase family serine protease
MRIVKSLLPALLLTILFSSLSYAAVPDRIAGAVTGGPTVVLSGNVNHQALPKYDQGPADPGLRLGYMTLLTQPTASQVKALKQLLAEQQDRKSPNFRKWLTPEQFADRFGLSPNDIEKLTAWLKSRGFKVLNVARARNFISFSGTAAQVQSAFGTELHRYNVNGEMHVANATAPRIPKALAGIVSGLRGLDDFYLKPRVARNSPAARRARPNYYDTIFQPPDFLAPGDIATIYDINALYNASPAIDGSGQKLAIIGQTDIVLADINDFRTGFGLPTISCTTNGSGVVTACNDAHLQYVVPTGLTDPGSPSLGDLTESDLDIEWSGATARGAQIVFVNAPAEDADGGVFAAWYYAVDNNLAPVISMSYGACEFQDNFVLSATGQPLSDELELMQANALGITFLNSSGDSGAAECDAATNSDTNNLAVGGLAVSYPASSPEVTGVGGTAIPVANFTTSYWGTTNGTDGGSVLTNGPQQGYIPEQAWNDDEELTQIESGTTAQSWQTNYAIVSTGGGFSNCAQQTADNLSCVIGFGQPSWQTVTVPNQAPTRFSPDVSLTASPNFPGYIFCTPQNAWVSGSSSTASTCADGIPAALALTDSSDNPSPSLVGGTSASSPIFAGIVALLNQYLGTNGLGNINPTLYNLAAASPSNGAFHQVTTGDNNVYCEVGQPAGTAEDPWPTALQCPASGVFGFSASNADAKTGYNLVTGLGSVDANKLALAWSAATPAPFTLAPTVANFEVAQGSNVDVDVLVTLANGFTGTITFTCSNSAPESTCTPPSQVNATGQVTYNVTTTAPTASLHRPFDRGSRIFYAALLPGLFGILLTAGTRKRSARGLRLLGLIMMLGFSTLWLGSCGGSSGGSNSNQGTPAGSYTVTVTGTSGSSTSSASFTLTVQ